MTYDDWIRINFPTRLEALGVCQSATKLMCDKFPELKRVSGWLDGRDHVWCVTSDGNIVDPTRAQYGLIGEYVAWEPGDEVCVGKCMNCGEMIYRHVETLEGPRECICSDECHASYAAYCSS